MITAASVTTTSGAVNKSWPAGETITAGMSVYLSASNTWLKAKCSGTAIEAGVGTSVGIALHAALNGQPLAVQQNGVFNPGATVVVGGLYCVSSTYGGIAPFADIATSTWRITPLFFGATATSANMDKVAAGNTALAVP